MSYGKPHPPQIHGFDPGRAYSGGNFPFVAPTYGSQAPLPSPATAPAFQNAPQMAHMVYPSHQSRPSYDEQSGPYLNVGSPVPEVTNYSPARGPEGTKVFVYITALYELCTANEFVFYLTLGQRKCPAMLSKVSQHGAVCQYTVAVVMPPFAHTGWSSPQVPVSMFMESGDGDVIAKVEVGHFTYTERGVAAGISTIEGSRKRKISLETAEHIKSPVKRSSSQQIRPKEDFSSYGYESTEGSGYSPYLQPSASYGNLAAQYGRTGATYQSQPLPRNMAYAYSTTSSTSPVLKARSPQWNSGYANSGPNSARSPRNRSSAPPSHLAITALPSPASATNPALVRTSTIPQTPSSAGTPLGGQQFNASFLYPNKAKLEISGDLDAMAQHWSPDEYDAKRRLVCFERSQSGSTINASFKPVTLENREPNSICISCIFWENKGECFITSVDTIYLLERLVDAKFTVEEKNRIRRNLEGFRPLTVSKGKQDSEDFFKVIMAFPNPKPRNIEKDVKVFHWKDLSSSLKKIFGKYSATPSSTLPAAPALLTPVSTNGYAATEASGVSYVSDHHAGSPRSISGSTTSTTYSSIPTRPLSAQNSKSTTALQGSPPDLRLSAPHPHETPSHWQGLHHMPGSQQQYQQQLGHQSARTSWDASSYLDHSAASAAAGGNAPQQPMSYANTRNIADNAITGGDNRISRSLSSQQQQGSRQMPRS